MDELVAHIPSRDTKTFWKILVNQVGFRLEVWDFNSSPHAPKDELNLTEHFNFKTYQQAFDFLCNDLKAFSPAKPKPEVSK